MIARNLSSVNSVLKRMKHFRGARVGRLAGSAVLLIVLGLFTALMVETFAQRLSHEPDVALAGISIVDAP